MRKLGRSDFCKAGKYAKRLSCTTSLLTIVRRRRTIGAMDWRNIVEDAEYVPSVVQPEMSSVVSRALDAGATAPLQYMGAGMTGVVFCNGDVAYKVARRVSPLLRRMLGDEAEWLAAAGRVRDVRKHVARLHGYDPQSIVIVRECPRRDPEMTSYRYGERRLSDLHSEIEHKMIPHGWTAPEFKPDSYVITKSGPVLVDASMPARVGHVLLDYVHDVMTGRRTTDERPGDLAFEVRREIGQTLEPQEAEPVLIELEAFGAQRHGDYRSRRKLPSRRRSRRR